MGYFVWPNLHDQIQNQSGAGPATTMAEYMKQVSGFLV